PKSWSTLRVAWVSPRISGPAISWWSLRPRTPMRSPAKSRMRGRSRPRDRPWCALVWCRVRGADRWKSWRHGWPRGRRVAESKPGVIGIDLGTTNSVVATVVGDRITVIPDAEGRRLHPSVVSFHPSGEVLTSYAAQQRRIIDARNTIFSAKRLIGQPF